LIELNKELHDLKKSLDWFLLPYALVKCSQKERAEIYDLTYKLSYSPYKPLLLPRPSTFLYANGPVYLTHVERLPDVPEINGHNYYGNWQQNRSAKANWKQSKECLDHWERIRQEIFIRIEKQVRDKDLPTVKEVRFKV